jgi:hypothetical protein
LVYRIMKGHVGVYCPLSSGWAHIMILVGHVTMQWLRTDWTVDKYTRLDRVGVEPLHIMRMNYITTILLLRSELSNCEATPWHRAVR